MVLLFTLLVGGVLWAVALQVSTEPVANRRIFGDLATILYIVAFSFVWLTALSWCAVESHRAAVAGRQPWPARDNAGWWWQGSLIVISLWLGTGAISLNFTWTDSRSVLILLCTLAGYTVLGLAVRKAELHRRMGRWLEPFVPVVAGLLLFLLLNVLIEWVGLGELLKPFHENLRSTAVFIGLAAFVALLLGSLLRRRGGETPLGTDERFVPAPADMGWVLMPMLAPVGAFACLHFLGMEPWWEGAMPSHGQVGLLLHAMLIPLLPAALLGAWQLDRRGGRQGWVGIPVLVLGAMAAWIVFGPELLWRLHPQPEIGARAAHFWGWDRNMGDVGEWVRLPTDGLVRAAGAMVLTLSVLSMTMIRRLGTRDANSAVPALLMLMVLQVAASYFILPKFGPLGAPLGCAVAAAAVWLYEVWLGGARHETAAVID
jgi:hypothetical protein